MDDLRARLGRVFMAPADGYSLAVSGTGSAGMETAVANLVREGTHVLVIVSGYFGERLADICARYGALVGRARRAVGPRRRSRDGAPRPQADAGRHRRDGARRDVDRRAQSGRGRRRGRARARLPDARRRGHVARRASGRRRRLAARRGLQLHAEGPRRAVRHGADLLLGARPRRGRSRAASTSISACSRRTGAAASITTRSRRRSSTRCARRWSRSRKRALEARWARHRRHHLVLAAGLGAMGLELLPPEGERLWTLNAVCVPDGVDEAAVRQYLLQQFNLEIGAGLGPLAGRIWRVGLMGSGSSSQLILLFLSALERALRAQGFAVLTRHRHGGGRRRAVVAHRRLTIDADVAGAWPAGSHGKRFGGLVAPLRDAAIGRVADRRGRRSSTSISPRSTSRCPTCVRSPPSAPDDHGVHRAAGARGARGGAPGRARPALGALRRHLAEPEARRAHRRGQRLLRSRRLRLRQSSKKSIGDVEPRAVDFSRGASTITQQLAKNLYLSPSRNPARKFRELLITRLLEGALTKRRILELYLNVVEWGDGVYGADAAARTYFRVPAVGPQRRAGGAARRLAHQPAPLQPGRAAATAARSDSDHPAADARDRRRLRRDRQRLRPRRSSTVPEETPAELETLDDDPGGRRRTRRKPASRTSTRAAAAAKDPS